MAVETLRPVFPVCAHALRARSLVGLTVQDIIGIRVVGIVRRV